MVSMKSKERIMVSVKSEDDNLDKVEETIAAVTDAREIGEQTASIFNGEANNNRKSILEISTNHGLYDLIILKLIGGFREGIPIDPKRKVNMEKKDVSFAKNIPDEELETEVEKLKQQILETKESFYGTPKLDLDEMIKKLERDVHREAVKAMGLIDRLLKLREKVLKVNAGNQLNDLSLKDKIEKLKVEFEQGLSAAPNYHRL
ncbi:hypothetical protein RJT34_12465 [Clitoria ternatea]|uniref:Uncharacterized protein n=1 Tax=Clitoria ternatea TaxID=43366 RepID=A0AAN9JM78_CLITE